MHSPRPQHQPHRNEPRHRQVIDGKRQRYPGEHTRRPISDLAFQQRFRHPQENPNQQDAPDRAELVRPAIEPAAMRRIQVACRHKGQQREEYDHADADPPRRLHHVQVERHHIPIRRKAQEVAVVRLGVHLAKTVGAGEQRGEQAPIETLRQQLRFPNEQERQRRVGVNVDEVVEPAAVETGQDFLDAKMAGQRSIRGVDHGGEQHQRECQPERCGRSQEDGDGDAARRHQPQGRVAVYAPGDEF